MKLDPLVMELTSLIERHKGQESYSLIPDIIREEIQDFLITPIYVRNKVGDIVSITFKVEAGYNKK